MGINPDEIKAQVTEAGQRMTAVIQHFDVRLNELERKLDLILQSSSDDL
ncbi:MAG TPA: hypothetical protein PLK61_04105 [Nitrosomonas sp.]|nr:hypothetical protein [Nitrosomonas sp.]